MSSMHEAVCVRTSGTLPFGLQRILGLVLAMMFVAESSASPPTTVPPKGIRENTPTVHALVGARIVAAPGRVIEKGTLVLRDGVIVAVGANVTPPPDARIRDCNGKTIHSGLIDAYGELSSDAQKGTPGKGGASYWNSRVLSQTRADLLYTSDPIVNKKLRSQGITARLVAPVKGIIKGTSAVVTTGDEEGQRTILKGQVAQHFQLTPPRNRNRKTYPNSPMGALALVRQALLDADWYAKAQKAYRSGQSVPRPERNDSLAALDDCLDGNQPIVFDAPNELYFLRADRVGKEFGSKVIIRGSGREYRRIDAICQTGLPILLPVNFPKAPNVVSPESAMSVSLEELLHWDLAPENPGRLDRAGVPFALTMDGLKDKGKFLAAVRKAIERGLSPESALRAMTLTPARLLGVEDRLGSLEPGKLAHLVITDGDLFEKKTKILEVWIDGKRYRIDAEPELDLRGTWAVTLEVGAGKPTVGTLTLEGKPSKLKGKLAVGEKESKLTSAELQDSRFACVFDAEPLGWQGIVRISAVVTISKNSASWLGSVVWADGGKFSCTGNRTSLKVAQKDPEEESGEDERKDPDDSGEELARKSLYAVNHPLGAFGRKEPPKQPKLVLFENAVVWTCGPQGILTNASVLVLEGKIIAVGKDLTAKADVVVVDATDKHITPGIIDCHSHIATDGGVNESAQAISAEVRIGDFIDCDDIAIYRQLAGGVTTSNILHGSANPIGGQNQVTKFRWGLLPEEMKFSGAPLGIKFALGENVKQSNRGDDYRTRYPQTRMGVEQIVRDEFRAAIGYRHAWNLWRTAPEGLPPRVDLELEAIVEVLEGKRLIHCHSYRQDEILALIRTCEDFGVQIATLQHVLEGYKVADVMARHGVMGSAFSDWWAYKFEVYDAIPYNGALMHDAGVVVSFNSDSAELGRRLNLEAAKAVKYGGVPPEEALKFVTLNAAKQLRIDDRVGSIEVGKDADLVIWSESPLSNFTVCEETWIDGRKYFDRTLDLAMREEQQKMKAALVQRILSTGAKMLSAGESNVDKRTLFPRTNVFCDHCWSSRDE